VPDGVRESLEDVIEVTRQQPEWASHFADFERPFTHVPPDEYRRLAEHAGFRVERLDVDDEAWDFGSREGFMAFADATFVFWTGRLPVEARDAFITAVLDRYQSIAADNPRETNTFKFYQMTVELAAV
jgi:trans-aconitate 2-methyltransferase